MLRERRLTTHFQPIVQSADPRVVLAHECLSRGVHPDGSLIPPMKLYQVATDANLLFVLGRTARLTAIRRAHEERLGSHIFINFTPSSIYDPDYCLRSTVAAVRTAGIAPERVVFEVVESERIHDPKRLVGILNVHRLAGFKVALDDLGAGYSSLNLLGSLRPDSIKPDMEPTRGIADNPFKATIAAKLLEAARALGVETVAEGVETDAEWRWMRDHGADYQQGFLFAPPAASPLPPLHPALAA